MEQITLNFKANQQKLTGKPFFFASNTVRYIKAVFDLGENWQGYDSVRAIWYSDYHTIATVLDGSGACVVPVEVLKRTGKVRVNLVGSISDNGTLTDRLTTYPLDAIVVDKNARVEGTETTPITPSQFEQFAENVHEDAERAYASAEAAETAQGKAEDAQTAAEYAQGKAEDAQSIAEGAASTAVSAKEAAEYAQGKAEDAQEAAEEAQDKAEQAAAQAGYMFFYIDENGDLIYQRTPNTQVDFYLQDGDLYVTPIAGV